MAQKIIFIICFLLSSFSNSQKIYDCEQLKNKKTIHQFTSQIDVNQKEYDINFIKNNFQKLKPKPLITENDDLGFTNHHFWVHFQIENSSSEVSTFFIETARPVTDIADLYIIDSDKITILKNGDLLPYSNKNFSDRKVIFKVNIAPKNKLKFYLHLKSDGEVLKVPIFLRTFENLMQQTSKEQLLFGVFYGILAIAAIIYLFFFFALREKTLLYYSLYVIFVGLMQFAIDGFFHQYSDSGWFSEHSVVFFAIIATILLGKYCEAFLKVKLYLPLVYKLFVLVYSLALILFLTYLVYPYLAPFCYPFANVLGLLILLLIISSLLLLYHKKIKVDPYFSVGILFLILGFVIFILNNFGQVSNTFFTQNSSKFGTGFEIIFLSLSMANLIRNLKNDKNELIKQELARSIEMNELKSYFLSNISHELRTPLNAIINLNEQNSKEKSLDLIQKNCEIIDYSSQSLLGSVNDILDFSKIQKNQLKLNFQPFDLNILVDKIAHNFKIQSENKGLDFEYKINNQIQNFLLGDPIRLQQVITNILNNAIKFTSEGFVKLEILLKKETNNHASLHVAVFDSGIGIQSEKKEKIFDSFSQNSITNKRQFGGLGLGLYIVKTLVDLKKGKIKLESDPNVGTTIQIDINYEIGEEIIQEEPIEFDFKLKNTRLLYVEDNKMNQMVIKMIVKKWKNTILEIVENGQECLSILEQSTYDLILMDLQMPIMDGYEATIEIRKGNSGINNKDIPIIALTADVIETTKQTVFDIGMNNYLTKPVVNELLYKTIFKELFK